MPLPIPTPEEMLSWQPDPAQKRTRWTHDIATGKSTEVELTLDEYRARHVAKIKSQNEREASNLAEQQREERQRVLNALIDEAIAAGK